jgi:hypothetical protein
MEYQAIAEHYGARRARRTRSSRPMPISRTPTDSKLTLPLVVAAPERREREDEAQKV